MSIIGEQSNINSWTSSISNKIWLVAKRSKKYKLSLVSERLKLDIDEIAKTFSELGLEILPTANTLINEEELGYLCDKYASDIHNFQDSGLDNYRSYILKSIAYGEWNDSFLSREKKIKIRKPKANNGHERFFRNQDILLSRPSKDSPVEKCVNSIIEIFVNFLERKDNWQKENNRDFSDEGTYDYFKQSDLQTIERDTLTKYRQLKNLLKRIVKGVKRKVGFSLFSIFFKRIIPLNLFHTYIADEDDINRVATNTFSFSKISIYQLREAVFHSINSEILIKNEIRFGGIN